MTAGRRFAKGSPRPRRAARTGLASIVWTLAGAFAVAIASQAVTVSATGGTLRVRAPAFTFIDGEILERLRDGRTQRIDFELTVLGGGPRGTAIASAGRSVSLSFDLWEERFAATRLDEPPQSVSHLTARGVEAWCLEQLVIPTSAFGGRDATAPFWIRLSYRAPDPDSMSDSEAGGAFTLRRLIDLFSRREAGEAPGRTIEAGPFRLSD